MFKLSLADTYTAKARNPRHAAELASLPANDATESAAKVAGWTWRLDAGEGRVVVAGLVVLIVAAVVALVLS